MALQWRPLAFQDLSGRQAEAPVWAAAVLLCSRGLVAALRLKGGSRLRRRAETLARGATPLAAVYGGAAGFDVANALLPDRPHFDLRVPVGGADVLARLSAWVVEGVGDSSDGWSDLSGETQNAKGGGGQGGAIDE